jgi:hypothetical protein
MDDIILTDECGVPFRDSIHTFFDDVLSKLLELTIEFVSLDIRRIETIIFIVFLEA